MKQLLTLTFSFIALLSLGQSSYYSVQTDNDNIKPTYLELLPWNENSLIQINEEFNSQTTNFDYSMEDISTGNPTIYSIPGCPALYSKPAFLSNGILASGVVANDGVELIYYDGLNSVPFDINLNGDSNPEIIDMGENTFVIAEDTSGARQLYKFDEASVSLTQVSWFQDGVEVTNVAAVWGDSIYYGIEFENLPASSRVYQLHEAYWDGNYYQSNVNSGVSAPSASNFYYRWNSPILKWGRMFILENKLSTDILDQIEQKIVVKGGSGYLPYSFQGSANNPLRMFEFGNNIFVYLYASDTLFNYDEYIQGNPQALSVNQIISSGSIDNHIISENGRVYLKKLLVDNTHELNRFDGQSLTPIFSGTHIHSLLENDDVIYFSNNESGLDTNSVILLNTSWDGVDVVKIEIGEHAPVDNAAVMYQDNFTFFFKDTTLLSTDVYQLTGSPLAELATNEVISLQYYPNPVSKNESFTIKIEQDVDYILLNSFGQVMVKGKLSFGENNIELNNFSSGVYWLRAGNAQGKIILTD